MSLCECVISLCLWRIRTCVQTRRPCIWCLSCRRGKRTPPMRCLYNIEIEQNEMKNDVGKTKHCHELLVRFTKYARVCVRKQLPPPPPPPRTISHKPAIQCTTAWSALVVGVRRGTQSEYIIWIGVWTMWLYMFSASCYGFIWWFPVWRTNRERRTNDLYGVCANIDLYPSMMIACGKCDDVRVVL